MSILQPHPARSSSSSCCLQVHSTLTRTTGQPQGQHGDIQTTHAANPKEWRNRTTSIKREPSATSTSPAKNEWCSGTCAKRRLSPFRKVTVRACQSAQIAEHTTEVSWGACKPVTDKPAAKREEHAGDDAKQPVTGSVEHSRT